MFSLAEVAGEPGVNHINEAVSTILGAKVSEPPVKADTVNQLLKHTSAEKCDGKEAVDQKQKALD